MAVPPHCLLTWSGVFGPTSAPIEEWQFSLKSDPVTDLPEEGLDLAAAGLATVYSENLASIMYPSVTLTKVSCVNIKGDGKFATFEDGSYQRGEKSVSVAGTSGQMTFKYPLQTALTVSLVTARPGPTGKGRFFLPFPAVALDDGHRIGTGQMPGLMAAIPEFVRDLQFNWGPPLVVASGGTKANGYEGYSSLVTGVRIGRVPDTMRSRRGDLIEAYESVTL